MWVGKLFIMVEGVGREVCDIVVDFESVIDCLCILLSIWIL